MESQKLAHSYLLWKTAVLKRESEGTTSSAEAEDYASAIQAFQMRMKTWYAEFGTDPESYLTLSEAEHSKNITTVKASEKAKWGKNFALYLPTRESVQICFEAHRGCVTVEFRALLYSLLQGLLYIVQCRRPVDVRGSAIQPETISKAIDATIRLDDQSFERFHAWLTEVFKFIAEVSQLKRQKEEHRRMLPGDLISFDLKRRLQSPEGELLQDLTKLVAAFDEDDADKTINADSGSYKSIDDSLRASFSHSEHFDSVNWFGNEHRFTVKQAAAVRVLWEAWEAGKPAVVGSELIDAAESEGDRVRDIFKSGSQLNPAWGTMIKKVPRSKNHFQLSPPTNPESQDRPT